jgi:hypothetical protein
MRVTHITPSRKTHEPERQMNDESSVVSFCCTSH